MSRFEKHKEMFRNRPRIHRYIGVIFCVNCNTRVYLGVSSQQDRWQGTFCPICGENFCIIERMKCYVDDEEDIFKDIG